MDEVLELRSEQAFKTGREFETEADDMAEIPESDMRATFDRYDSDKSGFIENRELRKAVCELLSGQKASPADIDAVTEVSHPPSGLLRL